MFFNEYPHTDFHELNLDWIIRKIKELNQSMSDFEALNKITFDGTWDITKQYPAWCIVNNGTQGYISIRPVPAGVVLGNNEYWRTVVDYTATIADLQNRVVDLENTVGDASSGLVKDVDDLKTVVGDASSGLVKDVDDLQTIVSGIIPNPITVLISDSYGVNSISPVRYSWFDSFDALEDGEVVSGALGGASFCGNNVNSYEDVLTSILSGMTADQKARVTDVIIGGGYNDTMFAGSPADELTAIESFLSACSPFTNLKNVHFFFIGNTAAASDKYTMLYEKRVLQQSLIQKGISFHDIGYVIHDYENLIQADGIHPTSTGANLIGSAVYTIYNGDGEVIPMVNSVYEMSSSSTAQTINVRCFASNGFMHISMAAVDVSKTGSDNNPIVWESAGLTNMQPMKRFYQGQYFNVQGTGDAGFMLVDSNAGKLRIIFRPMTTANYQNIKVDVAELFIPIDEC